MTPLRTHSTAGRLRLLDLFSGAGGASMGYHRAGFDVTGVDIANQRNYPFRFVKADAIKVLEQLVASGTFYDYAAIHASPPCQKFSSMTQCRPGLADEYEDFVAATRFLLRRTGLPYIIENVPGAPLNNPVVLCGQMFGLELYRHRLFESNFPITVPDHPEHVLPASKAGHWKPGTVMSVAGHVSPIAKAREVMDIGWMTREELAEAIPPQYTAWVGADLRAAISKGVTSVAA